jgi:hypothetical protein
MEYWIAFGIGFIGSFIGIGALALWYQCYIVRGEDE